MCSHDQCPKPKRRGQLKAALDFKEKGRAFNLNTLRNVSQSASHFTGMGKRGRGAGDIELAALPFPPDETGRSGKALQREDHDNLQTLVKPSVWRRIHPERPRSREGERVIIRRAHFELCRPASSTSWGIGRRRVDVWEREREKKDWRWSAVKFARGCCERGSTRQTALGHACPENFHLLCRASPPTVIHSANRNGSVSYQLT